MSANDELIRQDAERITIAAATSRPVTAVPAASPMTTNRPKAVR
ncbi:hypothetical protein [Agromyces albus]|nr:hypothetical protein [Agromyces albus]